MDTTAIILCVAALFVGVAVGYLVAAARAATGRSAVAAEIATARAAVESARAEAAGLREQSEAARQESLRRLDEAHALGDQRVQDIRRAADERLAEYKTAAEARIAQARDEAESRVAQLRADQEAEKARFESVAAAALKSNNEAFLELADQRLAQSTQKNEAVLAEREAKFLSLVEPMKKSLEQVQAEVAAAEKQRAAGSATLGEHLRQVSETSQFLRQETSELVAALKQSQTRGAWGELQLRRVVEAAGMLDHVDFTEQVTVTTDDGRLRPDMVIHLAGDKSIVVDAKVAFVGYLEASQASDPQTRKERMDAHVRHVRQHMKDLSDKAYWNQFPNAPEFVVMFLPAESFLSAAIEHDPSLFEDALRGRVLLASPMTLLSMLRTVSYAWRQDALAKNASDVLAVGRELYSRIVTMTGHVTKMGSSLERATENYNRFVGALERNVLTSARRMVALNVVDDGDAVSISGIEAQPKLISKPELLAADEERVVAIAEAS
jgi:DNA recombination protein RmuC